MMELAIILGFIAFCGLAAYVHFVDSDSAQRSLAQLKTELTIADHRINHDFHHARRAMNDAAGQSWRNLAG
ncbi:hypothetical protein [Mycobacterium sp. 1245852.3]|uniref:hypothetical protein n=1 Tax=Mycobacterium sp. 1245852.3 TaxID=1856860 RepID=UPI0007FE317E|nr:hypothetical protein [Mycobacterium sp. 1245852.3]OBK19138.1 hypothetical protein A9W96_05920 [Mycobacterium sp. 1245852.3]